MKKHKVKKIYTTWEDGLKAAARAINKPVDKVVQKKNPTKGEPPNTMTEKYQEASE